MNSWESDNCSALQAYYAVYSIPKAAALWCGIPESEVENVVRDATQAFTTGLGRSIWRHLAVPCLEHRSRAIAEAIESGELACGREDGQPVRGYVAPERRHVRGRDLKAWLEKAFPNEKPAFLFDDIERNSHTAIGADAYRALIAERDKLVSQLQLAQAEVDTLREQLHLAESGRASSRVAPQTSETLGQRAESTYQLIIAALLQCTFGEVAGVTKHPSFRSEANLIDVIATQFRGYGGLSQSTLSRKFPEAKQALRAAR